MKKFRLSLAFIAAVAGTGLAFLHSAPAKADAGRPTLSWFTYNGSGSPTDAANYTEVSGDPECPGTTDVCAIHATVGAGSKPVMTTALQNDINTALTTHHAQSDVTLLDD